MPMIEAERDRMKRDRKLIVPVMLAGAVLLAAVIVIIEVILR
jgi:hypothetical protein